MRKLASLFAVSLITSTFAAGAMAANVEMAINVHGNVAKVQLTKDGQPLADYPVAVTGSMNKKLTTDDQGVLVVKNHDNTAKNVTFVVNSKNGNTISSSRFLSREL